MDFISHGLWGGILFGRKRNFWLTFFIGLAPDVFSFGIYFLVSLLGLTKDGRFPVGPHDPTSFPSFVYQLYNVTHSLIVFGLVFLLFWLIFKKPFYLLFAWGFHIILDIFTHSFEFFPTPFLWPISDFKVDAWMWGNSWIFIPNVLLLLVLYILWWHKRRKIVK